MSERLNWKLYIGIAALLVLTLVLLWPDSNERSQHRDISPDTVNAVPVPASEPAPMRPVSEVSNPFSSSSFATPSPTEPSVKMDALQHETPVLNQEDKATDLSQWRKADERTRSYLGGPPGPGKPE